MFSISVGTYMAVSSLRVDRHGNEYEWIEFWDRYGERAHQLWAQANIPLRRAADGLAYTWEEYVQHYSAHAEYMWDQAKERLQLAPDAVTRASASAVSSAESAASESAASETVALLSPLLAQAPPPKASPPLVKAPPPKAPVPKAPPPKAAPPQPAQNTGVAQPGALHAPSPQASPPPVEAQPAAAQEAQSSALVVAAPLPPVMEWPCFGDSRSGQDEFTGRFLRTSPGKLGRSMIVWASELPPQVFPLLVHHLCDTDALLQNDPNTALLNAEPVAAISLEQVAKIPDPNQEGRPRIDFFVYRESGEIIRFHPGRTPKQGAIPHLMPSQTDMYMKHLLPELGAGCALHLSPPGRVALRNGGVSLHKGRQAPSLQLRCQDVRLGRS